MNEVTRIRLGRIAYDIDINAKKELEKYSRAIRKSLGQDSDVYDDIEIRMTEILADQGIQASEVITLNEVLAIESQLGQPGDFASDSNNSGAEADTDNSEPHTKTTKKYYRDVDHALAGGVLAGLSAYTGIDVTILRLIFVRDYWVFLVAGYGKHCGCGCNCAESEYVVYGLHNDFCIYFGLRTGLEMFSMSESLSYTSSGIGRV